MGLFESEDEKVLFRQLLEQMRYNTAHLTRTSELLASGVTNHVLDVATLTIPTAPDPSAGFITKSYQTTIGCMKVTNLGTAELTVCASSPTGPTAPPNGGFGTTVVPAGASDVVSIGARTFTIYGLSGQRVAFQVFTIGALAMGGLVAIDGGAP